MVDRRSNASVMYVTRLVVAAVCFAASVPHVVTAQIMQLPAPVGMAGNPAARSVLDGNAAFLRGDLLEATADYHAALRRKPDFAVAWFDLGLVEVHRGQRGRGLTDMDRGIALADRHGMGTAFVARLRALRNAFAIQRQLT